MIGIVKRNQYPVGIIVFTFRLLDLEHLGHIGCRNFFKMHKKYKQTGDEPGNGDVPRPGIEIELIDRQKHVEGKCQQRAGTGFTGGDACEHKNAGADHGPDADHGGIKQTEVAGKGNFSFS